MKITIRQLKKLIKESLQENHTPNIFMHVTAYTGCGKTTLMLKLQDEYPQYEFKDLDDFGDGAAAELGWPEDWQSKDWSQEKQDQRDQTANKQIYQFVQNALKPVVFFGIHHDHIEGQQPSEAFLFRPQHKILLGIPPEVCAERKFNRDRKRASVQPDGTIYFGGVTITDKPWQKPGISLDDPQIIHAIKEEFYISVLDFMDEVAQFGYQPVDEIGIRTLLTQGFHDPYENASINEGYFTDYAKHSTMNLGQVLRHLRYLTDLPNTTKREALKKRLRFLVNDLYYTIIPPQSHHTQEELDFQNQFSYGELLRMGFDPDFAEEMLSKASIE